VFSGIEVMEAEAGYARQRVHVHPVSDGEERPPLAAEAYFYSKPQRVARRPRVESGDWTQRNRPK
jgi:gamma-glutamylcyclotransferase (GGCT)/AIG2-like uncharacterized protein YtfP